MEFSRLAERQAIEFAVANLPRTDILHLFWNEVDGTADVFAPGFEVIPDHRGALIVLLHGFGSLVNDHDFRARFRHPDHLLDCANLVGEEIDTAHVKYAVESLDLKRKTLRLTVKEMGFPIPVLEIALAFPQHSP